MNVQKTVETGLRPVSTHFNLFQFNSDYISLFHKPIYIPGRWSAFGLGFITGL
jgi:hypothetical protein